MRKLILIITISTFINDAFAQPSKAALFIDSFARKNNFNGTILIKENSKAVYKKSFGFANFAFKVPNTTDTKYKVASITKAFTAVLILQLYEQGKIDLDKTITTYLPDYKGAAGDKVSVKQLLNMTSGMRNMDEGLTLESALKSGIPQYQLPHTPNEMLATYCSDTLVSKPGTRFDYNNAEYIILGKIIETVTGKSFGETLQEKILKPLNLLNSGMITQEKIIDKLADTYFYRDASKVLTNDLPVYTNNWYAAGAMYSTADDIAKFSDALFGRKLLKQETLNLMFTAAHDEYGLGVWVYKDYDINKKMFTIVKRPGKIIGAQSMLFHILENNSTIIILSNTGTVDLDKFAANIAEEIFR
ncbi:serine hydrolase domain-containing protein [Niastella sp. OAS944]|uniref:serine hydrolase domain-containing protein n=1 Tax=Niastella sp. OAS944 TaxID=2664089 RepID=UPI00346A1517|nr:CubicO group peptidase (beta-lactamase class C family) [Chitinophagaceae bacterium OAS944]